MKIAVPTSGGWTLEAQLEEDAHGMSWLHSPNRVTGKRQGRCLMDLIRFGGRVA